MNLDEYNKKIVEVFGVGLDKLKDLSLSIKGILPKTENEIIVGNKIADKLSIKVGSLININNNKFLVSGILNSYGDKFDNSLIMDLSRANFLINDKNKISKIIIKLPYSTYESGIINKIKSDFINLFGSGFETYIVKDESIIKLNIINKIIFFLHILSAFILILNLLSLSNFLVNSVKHRTREIGVLRTLGFKSYHIIFMILVEIILVAIIGVTMSFCIDSIMSLLIIKYILNSNFHFVFDVKEILLFIFIILMVSIISGLLPAKKAIENDPVVSLNFI
ncbi:FtsX-like permease family protein [Deferribacter thermophilus]|uniref:ABC transporter permease n=1 Tax=Deferribacter thermophilus TaxID=53573 RepID=UPI003C29400F